jgi:hypothetical protein
VWLVVLSLAAVELVYGNLPAVTGTEFDNAVSDIRWIGPDSRTLLLQTSVGKVHRSIDGGKSWSEITVIDGWRSRVRVQSILVSPADRSVLCMIGHLSEHYVSKDAGNTWTKQLLPAGKTKTWLFHDTKPEWVLYSSWSHSCSWVTGNELQGEDKGPCSHALYVSKDLGKTFTEISSHVIQFDWGSAPFSDRIYFTAFHKKDTAQPRFDHWIEDVDFAYTDDFGGTITKAVPGGNKFVVSHGFILIATMSRKKLGLTVSSDSGATFKSAIMPRHLKESSYNVLDTSEGRIVLHVNHGNGIGHVYTSDSTGVHFTLSLENNVRGARECGFENVMNLRGIYMANVGEASESDFAPRPGETAKPNTTTSADDDSDALLGGLSSRTQTDRTIRSLKEGRPRSFSRSRRTSSLRNLQGKKARTVISFDMGGAWSYVSPPAKDSLGDVIDCPRETCSLHLHDITDWGTFAPLYSYTNAVGIIMGSGNIGANLGHDRDTTNTYLSRDGGLTWIEAQKGDYIYEFGNHGGLLLMADWVHATRHAFYSKDQGYSWQKFEFAPEPELVNVANILTELSAMITQFTIYGTSTRTGKGVLYHVDFDQIGLPVCKGLKSPNMDTSDYETWTPSDGKADERCLLGRQKLYTRRKQLAGCLNSQVMEWPVTVKNCTCTEEDYECESGFVRKIGSLECLPENVADYMFDEDGNPGVCATAEQFEADSHRLVSQDTCKGGWRPKKFTISCAEARTAAQVMAKLAKLAPSDFVDVDPPSQGGSWLYLILKIALVCLLILGLFFASRSEAVRSKVSHWCGGARSYTSMDAPRPDNDITSFGAPKMSTVSPSV